jgi:hypothetical protein
MDLKRAGLTEIDKSEMRAVNGGLILVRFKLFDELMKWAGVYDAISDFHDGVKSAECKCCE